MYDRDFDLDCDVREEKPLGLFEQAGVSPSGRIGRDVDDPPRWVDWVFLAVLALAVWKLADLAMWVWSHVRIV